MCGVSTTLAHRAERVVGGEALALEVVEAGAAEVARRQRATSASMSCSRGPGGVDVDRAVLHARRTASAPIIPSGLGRDRGVHRHDVGLGEQVVERVGGVGGERVVR